MRELSVQGLQLIESFEGLRLDVYKDIVGLLTVGYGHKVVPADNLDFGEFITQQEADDLLQQDTEIAAHAVENCISVELNDNQFAACVSLCYNIGVTAFAHSTLARNLNEGNYSGAAIQFLVWNKAGGEFSKGLADRRTKEKLFFNLV